MTDMPLRGPVNIIGAGIAGLSLGQLLRARGVAVEIFDRGGPTPRHPYSITLTTAAILPLLTAIGLTDATMRQKAGIGLDLHGSATAQQPSSFRVNRARFESVLRDGLTIHTEHKLTEAVRSSDGLRLTFENGKKVDSRFTVAADGPMSQMRSMLVANSKPKVLPLVAINGKRWLSVEQSDEVRPAFEGKDKIEFQQDNVLLESYVNDASEGKLSLSYTYSRPPLSGPDALYKPDRSQAGASDIPEEYYEELRQLDLSNTAFKVIIGSGEVRNGRNLSWLMRSMLAPHDELMTLSDSSAYLTGEAAHALPILGSYGANICIEDAINLANHIADGHKPSKHYEDRYGVWQHEVEAGEERLFKMHGTTRDSAL